MNREIKFRFWETLSKKMTSSYAKFFPTGLHNSSLPDGLDSKDYDTPHQYYPDMGYVEDGVFLPCYVMQATGILDKNGKEIYEGDIVKCGYGIGKVVFNAGCFMVAWIDDAEAYMEFLFSKKGMYRREGDEQFEIIGNCFENTELLERG